MMVDNLTVENLPYVTVADERGAAAAAEHLIKLGHRRFGVISLELTVDAVGGVADRARQAEAAYRPARALSDKGINYFIPGAKYANEVDPKYPNNDPNSFWYEGAVTLLRIHQAKGNEADVVYVVGFDAVAKREDDITLRNQIFVALTRSRGWAHLSRVGEHPVFEEMRSVMACGERLSFAFTRPPKRQLVDE